MQFATLILEEGTHRKPFVGEILWLVAVLAVSAVLTLGTAALAGEKTLKLNRLGLRKQAVFKVYVGGLYLESPSKGACAILGWLRSRSPLWGRRRHLPATRLVP